MRLRQLVCFIRVCELGSISKAAGELNIAQPALGLQIRSLEHEFNAILMVRSSRGVTPTPAGEQVLQYSRDIIRQDRELRARLKGDQGETPISLTLGMTASLTHLMAGEIIEKARETLPDLGVKIIEGLSQVIAGWVDEERVDIGLAFGSFPTRSVQSTPLLQERLFYLSAPGNPDATVDLDYVLSNPLAVPDEQNSIRHTVEQAARTIDMPVIGIYEIGSLQAARDIARRGIAGTIAPYGGVAMDHQRGELSVRMITSPPVERTLFLMRREDRVISAPEQALTEIVLTALHNATASKAPAGAYIHIE